MKSWNKHYIREKSVLKYPDENLVRLLRNCLSDRSDIREWTAIDLGCGSGRHIKLLEEAGIGKIIGVDLSYNALSICKRHYNSLLIQAENLRLPMKDNSIDIAVSWGSLHYCEKIEMNSMLTEIYRILKKSGILFGTLRTNRDTYLKRGKHIGDDTWITDFEEIENTVVSFYSEDELQNSLAIYRGFRYGIMERSVIGDIEKIISHWFFWARK